MGAAGKKSALSQGAGLCKQPKDSNSRQVTLVHNKASCPRELLLQCLQIESSEYYSATSGRLCPEPRNVKQMSASGIFPGRE